MAKSFLSRITFTADGFSELLISAKGTHAVIILRDLSFFNPCINCSINTRGKENIEISISHSRMNAVAVCIIKEAE